MNKSTKNNLAKLDQKEQKAYSNSVKFLIDGNRKAYRYWHKQHKNSQQNGENCMRKIKAKNHPELSLGKEYEHGTAQTMIWHYLKHGVELPTRLKP